MKVRDSDNQDRTVGVETDVVSDGATLTDIDLDSKNVVKISRDSFVPLDMHGSSYKIRGSGTRKLISTPLMTIILAIIIIAGLAGLGFTLYNIIGALANESEEPTFSLTSDQTRNAIDGNTPVLMAIIPLTPDEAKAKLIEQGFVLIENSRYITESPDITAAGTEVVRVPEGITEDDLKGYYEGSFNAYTTDELQSIFNGAWILDLTQGESGKLFKLKYTNLLAKSIDDEIFQIQSLVGLTGDDVTISKSGEDSAGNTFAQGTKVITEGENEKIYYWRVAACPLDEIYYVDRIPDEATYLTVTLAEFDFISNMS